MDIITTTGALADICDRAKDAPYVTLDTEFLRERTYYAQLCLIQMALPGPEGEAVLIDPLADGLSLDPLMDLFRNTKVVKVFHAARQDLEIFSLEFGVLPEPLFDTQVAAMVCGFGDQVGYETLVRKVAKKPLDKSSRFTDWSRRPLTDAQMTYALADVTHLRVIYEYLAAELDRSNRRPWVVEELAVLTDPDTYVVHPEQAWKRVKTRTNSGKFLAHVQTLAEFRERFAQDRNVPRSRVFKDDALLELASTKPQSVQDLSRSRLLLRDARKGEIAEGILRAVRAAAEMPASDHPRLPDEQQKAPQNSALSDLLRVLLKAKSEQANVAQKLLASAADLDAIAGGERDLPVLRGWRAEVFGKDALRLCSGEVALACKGRDVVIVPAVPDQPTD